MWGQCGSVPGPCEGLVGSLWEISVGLSGACVGSLFICGRSLCVTRGGLRGQCCRVSVGLSGSLFTCGRSLCGSRGSMCGVSVVESVGLWEIPVGGPTLLSFLHLGQEKGRGTFLSISLLSLLQTGDDGAPGHSPLGAPKRTKQQPDSRCLLCAPLF